MTPAGDPHGAALLDSFRDDGSATPIRHREGTRGDVPAGFRLRTTVDPLEAMAPEHSRRGVLDPDAEAASGAER
jgi:hypothetical protein